MLTLAEPGRAKLVRKRSRFLAFAYPVAGEGEAAARVNALRREYHDARHVAYAYRILSHDRVIERADDAGEPARSAGWPILELLRGRDLVNVLVGVVRYFGGVKLGVGGLRRAYRDAAALALEGARMVEFVPHEEIKLVFAPGDSGRVYQLLNQLSGAVCSQGFVDGRMVLTVRVPRDKVAPLREMIHPWGTVQPVE